MVTVVLAWPLSRADLPGVFGRQGVASIACVRRAACVSVTLGPGACLGRAAAGERVEVHINAMLRDRTGNVQLILT